MRAARGSAARMVRIGGMSRAQLLRELQENGVQLNPAAEELFSDSRFVTSRTSHTVETIEVSVAELGYSQGATYAEITKGALGLGLSECPLELGPHLRLQFLDQPEGFLAHPPSQHRAPPGSVTVASRPLDEDDQTPKGFYLRRIRGALWLRAYRSGPEHIWSPEDRLVFLRPGNATV